MVKVESLRTTQQNRVERLVDSLLNGFEFEVSQESDFASREFALEFGDLLLLHHNASSIPMTKDKFEYAFVDALSSIGLSAEKLPNGNPGADIVVGGIPWSLKTQADAQIKIDRLHISKFMELGKGEWETREDISELRNRMFFHMANYSRIFSLRNLKRLRTEGKVEYLYELVEIPMSLLLSSQSFPIEIKENSRQNPKPASCLVTDADGNVSFELYFDGGTERKLQVKAIDKNLCVVHATWGLSIE
tara:strand:+ start:439 stop:1179 length:741 start_codon:yes stop_codon:yes gene_type:complete